jgi:hypothetical protein
MSFLSKEIAILQDIQTLATAAQSANVQGDETTIMNVISSGGINIPFPGLLQAAISKEEGNVAAGAGALADILTTFQNALNPPTSGGITVPNVVGMTQAAAQANITNVSLTVGSIGASSSTSILSGSVISQSPSAGTSATSGTAVSLIVSSGPAAVSIKQ